MSEITHKNHFVSQAYLRNWADEEEKVWVYDILVPHRKVPEWAHRNVRSLARQTDLYTVIREGRESDEFERWLNDEIENPAVSALRKVAEDAPLNPEDWERLAYYAAAQDRRTPSAYLEEMENGQKTLPEVMQQSLARSIRALERASRKGKVLRPAPRSEPAAEFPMQVEVIRGESGGEVRVTLTLGRELWLNNARRLVTKLGHILVRHQWTIMRPSDGVEWFTSDHPLLRLNYYAPGRYDFLGGWGNRGSEIIFPLTPRHLMYTKIGTGSLGNIQLDQKHTFEIQQLIAERARRTIIGRKITNRVRWFRPRQVNLEAYRAEEAAWENWHAEQSRAELRT